MSYFSEILVGEIIGSSRCTLSLRRETAELRQQASVPLHNREKRLGAACSLLFVLLLPNCLGVVAPSVAPEGW